MTRIFSGLCLAGALAFAVTVNAQSTTTDQRSRMSDNATHDVTVTGCLTKSGDGNYMLTNARMDTTGSTGSTTASSGTAVTGGTTVGTTGGVSTPTNTAEAANAAMGSAMTWLLQGGNDLDKHVGHTIQVTGRTAWDPSSMDRPRPSDTAAAGTTSGSATTTGGTTTSGTTGTTGEPQRSTTTDKDKDAHGNQPRLDVQSIKMIASSCQ